jgi:lipoprotein-anchoring transpeptidase ErfK/SrfK
VQLPGPPNGLSGWVSTSAGTVAPDPWSIVVSLGARTVAVYSSGRVVATAPAAVGAPSTPTPSGWTFIDGDIQTVGVDSAEAPVLRTLALHQLGRAAAIDQAEISATQIAVHGWGSGTVTGPHANPTLWSPDGHGHAVSHGCIRIPVGAGVLGLIAKIPNGTRVDITT